MAEFESNYRGRGPRGYVRSPERIREDICDRLTDNPFVDASEIEVWVTGSEVRLAGTVDNETALRQAQEIAAEAVGVTHVHNELRVKLTGIGEEPSPGDEVNRALHTPVRG